MHLLNTLWQKRSSIVLVLLSLFFSFLTIMSFWHEGPQSSFFVIDPDIVYFANALSLIYQKNIIFIDHPGTPSIMFMAIEILISKVYIKLFLNIPDFLKYILDNLDSYVYYARLTQSFLLSISLSIASYSIYKLTKKYVYVICFLVILFVYMPVYYLGSSISAETFNLLLLSIWLLMLTRSLVGNRKNLTTLNILSGLLFANRATNFFVILASLYLYLNIYTFKFNIKKILTKLTYFVIAWSFGFIVGIAPIFDKLVIILKRLFLFANSTEIHGNGSAGILDVSRYIDNLSLYFQRDLYFSIIVLMSIFVALFNSFSKDKFIKLISRIILVFAFGILIFIKFPLGHYLVPAYFILTSLFVILISKFDYKYTLILFLLCLVPMIKTNISFQNNINVELKRTKEITMFINNNQPEIGSVYDWSRTKAFSYLWINNYSNGVANNYLSDIEPKIYNLYSIRQNLIGTCWDRLVIQDELIDSVFKDYPRLSKTMVHIPDTNLNIIKSDHCVIVP